MWHETPKTKKMECVMKWFVGNNANVRAILVDCFQKLTSDNRCPNVQERRQIDTMSLVPNIKQCEEV